MGTVISVFLTALMRVVLSVSTARVAERVVRKMLRWSIAKTVESTQNTIDDELVAPILRELDALDHLDSLES